jgi:hypothetical protein
MLRNWVSAAVLALLGTLAFESTSSAQSPPTKQAKGEWGQVVEQLRAAHKLLVEADHDYSGHRARAAEEVHKAIKELTGYHHPKVTQPGTTSTAATSSIKPSKVQQSAGAEAQATSDAQLRQAQTILSGVQGKLNSRHHKAAANVQAALAEITMALSVK